MRTRRLGRKLIRMQRAYLAGLYAGQAMDSQREIIPRAHTLVAEMIDTGNNPPVDSRKNGTCQIIGICRCAYLVEDNPQRLSLTSQTKHRLHKIIPVNGIEPCCTDNHGTAAMLHHRLLTCQFSRAIYRIGASGRLFRIGSVSGSVENIIGGHLYQGSTASFGSSSQIARSDMIQLVAKFLIILCLVHRRISSAIHNHIYPVTLHKPVHSLFVANVQFLHVSEKISMLSVFFRQHSHFIAKLTVGTGYQNIHLIKLHLYIECYDEQYFPP